MPNLIKSILLKSLASEGLLEIFVFVQLAQPGLGLDLSMTIRLDVFPYADIAFFAYDFLQ